MKAFASALTTYGLLNAERGNTLIDSDRHLNFTGSSDKALISDMATSAVTFTVDSDQSF